MRIRGSRRLILTSKLTFKKLRRDLAEVVRKKETEIKAKLWTIFEL